MLSKRVDTGDLEPHERDITPLFGSRVMKDPIPRYELPDGEMAAAAAYQLIHDELSLDGNPLLNLASFVTTWMEPEAERLMTETMSKNFIDQEEYPQTSEIERRCVSIIAGLLHAPTGEENAIGTSTVGSSEAIHLCGLALKRNWAKRRATAGLPADRPNLVMGANVQVVWEKFVRYFDVEPRYVNLAPGRTVIGVDEAMALVDENTIAVVGILGSTYTGEFEPIAELDAALTAINDEHGWQVPIHVDAASGGFVAPFANPDLEWDFRLRWVRSINVSGHKYGLVYPGVGWAIWRDAEDLPAELIFHDNYLGNDQTTFDLNFSKGANQIIGQYYNFIRLGRAGYAATMDNLLATSGYLAKLAIDAGIDLLSKPNTLPVVCARFDDGHPFSAFDLSAHLRQRGWIVPAYTLPADLEDITLLRVVIREGFSRDMADNLARDLDAAVRLLTEHPPATPHPRRGGHRHVC